MAVPGVEPNLLDREFQALIGQFWQSSAGIDQRISSKTSKATTCLLNNYSIPVEKLHFVATPVIRLT